MRGFQRLPALLDQFLLGASGDGNKPGDEHQSQPANPATNNPPPGAAQTGAYARQAQAYARQTGAFASKTLTWNDSNTRYASELPEAYSSTKCRIPLVIPHFRPSFRILTRHSALPTVIPRSQPSFRAPTRHSARSRGNLVGGAVLKEILRLRFCFAQNDGGGDARRSHRRVVRTSALPPGLPRRCSGPGP